MNLSYVTTGHEGIASFRYRIQEPAMHLHKHGVFPTISNKAHEDAKVVLFSKHWTSNDVSYARFCKLRGQRVIYDICDDHFDTMPEHYNAMCSIADTITVNSEAMATRVKEATGRDAVVIPDPVLSPRGDYKQGEPRLLWYGQKMNIQGLYDVYPKDVQLPMEVIVPSRLEPPEHFNRPWLTWTQWHKDIIEEAAQRATIAVLPYRQGKDAKSANRVLEALWSGLCVCTDPIPSVQEIKTDCIFDLSKGSLQEGVQFFTSRSFAEEMGLIQKWIEWKFSPDAVTKQWAKVIKDET